MVQNRLPTAVSPDPTLLMTPQAHHKEGNPLLWCKEGWEED